MSGGIKESSLLVSLLKSPPKKAKRFFESLIQGVEPGRKGSCTPEVCSTADGKIEKAACCHFDYNCPLLSELNLKCKVYILRPIHPNCNNWPHNREELKKVKNCGYYWE